MDQNPNQNPNNLVYVPGSTDKWVNPNDVSHVEYTNVTGYLALTNISFVESKGIAVKQLIVDGIVIIGDKKNEQITRCFALYEACTRTLNEGKIHIQNCETNQRASFPVKIDNCHSGLGMTGIIYTISSINSEVIDFCKKSKKIGKNNECCQIL